MKVEHVSDVFGDPIDHSYECSYKKGCCLVRDLSALALYYDTYKNELHANQDSFESFVHFIIMGVNEDEIDVCAWRALVQRVHNDDQDEFCKALSRTFHMYSDGIEDLYRLEAMWNLSKILPMIQDVVEAHQQGHYSSMYV
jgi:hypothetical protein